MPQFIKVATRDPPGTVAGLLPCAGRISNEKTHGVLTVSFGQDTKADHGTTIGSREASDPDALRSGRAG